VAVGGSSKRWVQELQKLLPFEGVAAETAGAYHFICNGKFEDPCKHYAYYHRCHYRRGRHQTPLGSAMGSYCKSFVGVDLNDPGERIVRQPGYILSFAYSFKSFLAFLQLITKACPKF
jgi:hypothetical protein